ncbi:TPA: hypothetical protein EYP45_03700 [Candidatus Peregrinibacteria bacterium]|nr:hypothetical protein [Candidatus Peregrinibacteria bacterium]
MKNVIFGIQGDIGSTNERACKYFAKKMGIAEQNLTIKYLISSTKVLHAVINKTVDYGTFAVFSSRQGIVDETEKAIAELSRAEQNSYKKINEVKLQLDHALLQKKKEILNNTLPLKIYSHRQALLEHKKYLFERFKKFPKVLLIPEIDTALAAENLSENKYQENSIVIAPIICEKLYNLHALEKDMPTNKGYETTFYLIEQN